MADAAAVTAAARASLSKPVCVLPGCAVCAASGVAFASCPIAAPLSAAMAGLNPVVAVLLDFAPLGCASNIAAACDVSVAEPAAAVATGVVAAVDGVAAIGAVRAMATATGVAFGGAEAVGVASEVTRSLSDASLVVAALVPAGLVGLVDDLLRRSTHLWRASECRCPVTNWSATSDRMTPGSHVAVYCRRPFCCYRPATELPAHPAPADRGSHPADPMQSKFACSRSATPARWHLPAPQSYRLAATGRPAQASAARSGTTRWRRLRMSH